MEKTTNTNKNVDILVIIIVAILVVLFAVVVSFVFNFSIVENIVMSWILTTFYTLFVFFMVDKPFINKIQPGKIIERIVEVIKEVPIENKIIEIVERIKEVPVYINTPIIRKKLNIKRYNYVASSEAGRYHKRSCRLGKLIKKKYAVHNDSQAFFRKKHFKPCKMCIGKKRKISQALKSQKLG